MRDEIVVEWIYEWNKGTPIHRRVQTHLNESRKGNIYFELGRDPYVITDLKNGAPVLGRKNGRWTTVGRVLRRGRKVFHGKRDEPSLDELLDMGRQPVHYPLNRYARSWPSQPAVQRF